MSEISSNQSTQNNDNTSPKVSPRTDQGKLISFGSQVKGSIDEGKADKSIEEEEEEEEEMKFQSPDFGVDDGALLPKTEFDKDYIALNLETEEDEVESQAQKEEESLQQLVIDDETGLNE